MADPSSTPTLVFLALSPLIAWRLYSRIRRMVGRQKSSAARHWFALCFFPLILTLLAAAMAFRPNAWMALGALGVGILCGVVLAMQGLKLTRFEALDEGFFYTPNAHIGIALSLLFVGRLLYRFVSMYLAGLPAKPAAAGFDSSPLTLAILGMLAGYYVAYAVGLLRWRNRVARERARAADTMV